MLETAQRAINQAGLGGQISLARAYAEDLDRYTFGLDTAFDDIVFSYSLSMIPDWRQALQAASAVLSRQGRMHSVDFELMRELEENATKFDEFQILAGRYAFILVSKGCGLPGAHRRVASGSQGMDKTGLTTF